MEEIRILLEDGYGTKYNLIMKIASSKLLTMKIQDLKTHIMKTFNTDIPIISLDDAIFEDSWSCIDFGIADGAEIHAKISREYRQLPATKSMPSRTDKQRSQQQTSPSAWDNESIYSGESCGRSQSFQTSDSSLTVPSCNNFSSPENSMAGHLYRLMEKVESGVTSKHWMRYFINLNLDNGEMVVFKKQTKKASVSVGKATVSSVPPDVSLGRQYCFMLASSLGSMIFSADSAGNLRDWLQAFSKVCQPNPITVLEDSSKARIDDFMDPMIRDVQSSSPLSLFENYPMNDPETRTETNADINADISFSSTLAINTNIMNNHDSNVLVEVLTSGTDPVVAAVSSPVEEKGTPTVPNPDASYITTEKTESISQRVLHRPDYKQALLKLSRSSYSESGETKGSFVVHLVRETSSVKSGTGNSTVRRISAISTGSENGVVDRNVRKGSGDSLSLVSLSSIAKTKEGAALRSPVYLSRFPCHVHRPDVGTDKREGGVSSSPSFVLKLTLRVLHVNSPTTHVKKRLQLWQLHSKHFVGDANDVDISIKDTFAVKGNGKEGDFLSMIRLTRDKERKEALGLMSKASMSGEEYSPDSDSDSEIVLKVEALIEAGEGEGKDEGCKRSQGIFTMGAEDCAETVTQTLVSMWKEDIPEQSILAAVRGVFCSKEHPMQQALRMIRTNEVDAYIKAQEREALADYESRSELTDVVAALVKKGSFANSEISQTMSRHTHPLVVDKQDRFIAESTTNGGAVKDLFHLRQPPASSSSETFQEKANNVGVDEARSTLDGQSNKKKYLFLNRQLSSAETDADDDDHNSTIITARNIIRRHPNQSLVKMKSFHGPLVKKIDTEVQQPPQDVVSTAVGTDDYDDDDDEDTEMELNEVNVRSSYRRERKLKERKIYDIEQMIYDRMNGFELQLPAILESAVQRLLPQKLESIGVTADGSRYLEDISNTSGKASLDNVESRSLQSPNLDNELEKMYPANVLLVHGTVPTMHVSSTGSSSTTTTQPLTQLVQAPSSTNSPSASVVTESQHHAANTLVDNRAPFPPPFPPLPPSSMRDEGEVVTQKTKTLQEEARVMPQVQIRFDEERQGSGGDGHSDMNRNGLKNGESHDSIPRLDPALRRPVEDPYSSYRSATDIGQPQSPEDGLSARDRVLLRKQLRVEREHQEMTAVSQAAGREAKLQYDHAADFKRKQLNGTVFESALSPKVDGQTKLSQMQMPKSSLSGRGSGAGLASLPVSSSPSGVTRSPSRSPQTKGKYSPVRSPPQQQTKKSATVPTRDKRMEKDKDLVRSRDSSTTGSVSSSQQPEKISTPPGTRDFGRQAVGMTKNMFRKTERYSTSSVSSESLRSVTVSTGATKPTIPSTASTSVNNVKPAESLIPKLSTRKVKVNTNTISSWK